MTFSQLTKFTDLCLKLERGEVLTASEEVFFDDYLTKIKVRSKVRKTAFATNLLHHNNQSKEG